MKEYRVNEKLSFKDLRSLGDVCCLYPELCISLFKDSGFRIWLRSQDEESASSALALFGDEEDEQVGLFKASYVLSPGHGLVFNKRSYPNVTSVGTAILGHAPGLDESAYELINSQSLTWYLNFRSFPKEHPETFAQIKELALESKGGNLESYFALAYRLSGKKSFFFNGREFPTIKDFFMIEGRNPKVMENYDFLTMPYCAAYFSAIGEGKRYSFAKAVAESNRLLNDYFLASKDSQK